MSDSYLSVAETAKLVRAALKKAFPATKFSVRSSSYSGGASIDIGYTDGPTLKAVNRITGRYTGADFDGMIDLKHYNSSWLMPDGSALEAHSEGTEGSMGTHSGYDNAKPHPDAKLVHFGADFIFVHRAYSVPVLMEAVKKVTEKYHYDVDLSKIDVVTDSTGAYIPWECKEADKGGDSNPTSIWNVRNLSKAYLENKYPFEEPSPGDEAYEELKAKVAALEAKVA